MPTDTLSSIQTGYAPPLTAKLAPWMVRFLERSHADAGFARELINHYGSPVHVTVASEFRRNVNDLLSPLRERGIKGNLFFARKANKLPWFVREAGLAGVGVDTASLQELRETLDMGVAPERVITTAIGKDESIISLAIVKGAMIVIDNGDELELVCSLARSTGKKARVGLRFSGFELDGRKLLSRFGFDVAEAHALLQRVIRDESDCLSPELLHAHLDRYDTRERAAAGFQLLEYVSYAANLGCKISAIDLGGGILMRYLESSSEWEEFQKRLLQSVEGKCPPFTFMNDGLGYQKAGDTIFGKPDLYPVWNNLSKERFISAVLDTELSGKVFGKEISQRNINLNFEPGRALLDNTGLTLTRVTFRKRDGLGNMMVGTAMNRTNLRPFRAEFCSDPILLSLTKKPDVKPEATYLVGNLCSESDLLFRRKLRFDHLPAPEDIFCFANTAGYLAHHMEIGTHGGPLPVNVLIDSETLKICETFGNECKD